MLGSDFREHVGPDQFRSVGWLPVSIRVDHIMISYVFKIKHGLAPLYLQDAFLQQSNVHSYNTRLSHNGAYALPKVKSFGMKSFRYLGAKLWNSLNSHLVQITEFNLFKSSLKKHLFSSLK